MTLRNIWQYLMQNNPRVNFHQYTDNTFIFHRTILPLEGRMVPQNIRFGEQESKTLFSLESKGVDVFTIDDVKKILGSSDYSVWHVISGLKRKNRIQQIEKGKYLLVPAKAGIEGYWSEEPWVIVPHLIDTYYIGFLTAMSYWNMTEQIPIMVFVATTKKKDDLEFGNQKFKFIKLSNTKFFGYVKERRNNTEFNISSKEKTIVDGLIHPEYCGGIIEVTKAMWTVRKEVKWEEVLTMTQQVGVNVALRRLGYLLSILHIKKNIIKEIEKITFKGYSILDPRSNKKKLGYSKNFGLILNKTSKELTGWMEY